MTRSARRILLCLAAVAALAAGGCGNKEEVVTLGETEGTYLTVDDLKYQVQISRILNPADVEDQAYLRGVSEGDTPARDETWFAVFMRVENDGEATRTATGDYKIVDTRETEFRPLELDPKENLVAYRPRPIPPGGLLPVQGSPASDNTIQGALLLFKLKTASLYNRPLELRIASTSGGPTAVVDLDI